MALIVQHPAIGKQSQQGAKSEMPIGDSEFLMNVSYDPAQMQATVTMKNGAQYLYFQVYPNVFDQWMQSRSKGEFYSKNIKGAHQSTRTISKAVGRKISATSKKTGRTHG